MRINRLALSRQISPEFRRYTSVCVLRARTRIVPRRCCDFHDAESNEYLNIEKSATKIARREVENRLAPGGYTISFELGGVSDAIVPDITETIVQKFVK